MEYISSRNIFLLLRDTLKLIDRKPMDHGSRVGYLVYIMLKCKGGYEQFELADFLMLTTLHDIGAYKTDKMGERLTYEFKNPMPHSVFGFLFLKNISPLADKAKMVLYHRVPCDKIKKENFDFVSETQILMLAEAAEVYHGALKNEFDYKMFRKQQDIFYTKEALDLLDEAVEKYDVFSHLADESYQHELDELLEYMIFTNEEKHNYVVMLMMCLMFRSKIALIDAATCLSTAEKIAEKMNLSETERERLYYATAIHDIGMLSVPSRILEAPRGLEEDEIETVRKHIELENKILSNRMDPEVVRIATAHHERLDGSGYPYGLTAKQMSKEQFILQVADVVTGMSCERNYREQLSKEEIIKSLTEEASKGKLDAEAADVYISNYDEITQYVEHKVKETVTTCNDLIRKYEVVRLKMSR